jgi:hypothetical protein
MWRSVARLAVFVGLFFVASHAPAPTGLLYADAGMCYYYGSAYKYDYANNYLAHYANDAETPADDCTSWGQNLALSDCAAVCNGVSQHGLAYCYVYWDLFQASDGQDPQPLGHVQQQYDCADVR